MPSGNMALCDVDPRDVSTGLVVAMARVPERPGGSREPGSRAWLFELHDGTLCRPIVDPRREVSGAMEIYGCKFTFSGEADGVLGELDSSTGRLDHSAGPAQQKGRTSDDQVVAHRSREDRLAVESRAD